MEVINHIEIRNDKAYIRGTNKKAEMIARMYVGTTYDIEDVMAQYNLSAAEVHAAIAYYYDNRKELDKQHPDTIASTEENALTLDKLRAKISSRQVNDSQNE